MSNVNEPNVSVTIVGANTVSANATQKVLFVGQQVAAGTATTGALTQNILNDNSWDTLYGLNSMLAGMIRNARALNGITQFDAIGLVDASGTPAAGSIAFSGTATEAGTFYATVGSELNHKYTIAVASGATAASLGVLLEAAINADTKCPCTGTDTTGSVAIASDQDGTVGNSIGLECNGTVAGITVTVTGMTSGATDPTLTSVLDAIGTERYQTIVWPWADLTAVKTLLDARFNVTNAIEDGIAITAQTDTHANHLTALGLLNSQSIIYLCDETTSTTEQKGGSMMEIPYSVASQVAAIRSLRLTVDANLADINIIANGTLDAFGGAAQASKPYFNTNMANLPITAVGIGFNATEVAQLLAAGGSVVGNNSARNGVVMGEMVTTYKTDAAGNADVSFGFANYVDTSSTCREFFSNNLKTRFAQSRLTTGAVVRGRDMANQVVIEAKLDELYSILSGVDYVCTEAGADSLAFFKANRTVAIDMALGKVTITMLVPIVTQLRTIIATMQIAFGTGA